MKFAFNQLSWLKELILHLKQGGAAAASITSILYLKDEICIATAEAADSVVKFWDTINLKSHVAQACPHPESSSQKGLRNNCKYIVTNLASTETEVPQEPVGKKEPSKKAAATKKKPVISLSEISESMGEIDINNEYLEVVEVAAAPECGKKGGRKSVANSKEAKPHVAVKKRGPAAGKQSQAQQKLLTEMLKPAVEGTGISPEKKVRKMRASPFNKKNGSVLGRVGISKS
ncbi:hypothetical protein REPUB_Repub07fG0190900 [Reevesia pubescens]